MSVVGVRGTMDIQALVVVVSNVLSVSWVESSLLVSLVLVLSDDGVHVVSESVSLSSRDGSSSVSSWSDGSGSSVEDEPLSVVPRVRVSDSKSVLVSTNVLRPEEGSVSWHQRFDLESSTIWKWLSWIDHSSSVKYPTLVGTVMAVPEDDVSVVMVVTTMDIQALSSVVSDVSESSSIESRVLVDLSNPWSDDGSNSDSVALSLLVRDGKLSSSSRSDSSSSLVEDEPLLSFTWHVVSDSESVLVSTNVLVPEEGLSSRHLRSDLESDAVSPWLSWVLDTSLINVPGLVLTVVAVPEDNVSVVSVRSTMDIETFLSVVSDVSVGTVVPSDSLVVLALPLSDGSSNTNSELVSSLVGDDEVSSSPSSDGLGSGIEGPPLLVVSWVVVSDSESVLVSSNVLVPEEGSVSDHSSLDLELNTVTKWVWWVLVSNSVNEPTLVGTVVALPPDHVSVVMVVSTMDIEALVVSVSDVSDSTSEHSHLLSVLGSPVSSNSVVSVVLEVVGVNLDGDNLVSVSESSDGSGSPVEGPPLSVVSWVVVLDSQSVLVRSNVLMPEEGLSSSHS